MSKRKMPRRELPFISTLLDKLPYSKLPTNGVVLRRLMFETQEHNGSGGISTASITVMEELVKVWEYLFHKKKNFHPSRILQEVNEDSFCTTTN